MRKLSRRAPKRRASYHVYILCCKSGAYYTGYTSDLKRRIKMHNSGRGAKYLRGKGPMKLVYARPYINYKSALNAERDIKTFSRKEKDALVAKYAKRVNVR